MERFARHTILKEIGVEGQKKLSAASVLIIGVGGLGSPISLYLTAAGVGRIGLVDADTVSLTNLQRQVIYSEDEVGESKTLSAKNRLNKLSSSTNIECYNTMFTENNAMDIASGYDIIIDGCDNIKTRYLMSQTAQTLNIPYLYGAISEFDGQVSLFNYNNGVNYEDLFPIEIAELDEKSTGGVVGALPGIIGSIMAIEAIKVIVGCGEPLRNRILAIDTLSMNINILALD